MTVRSLVAGGAGFIGSNLCDRLIAEGHEVYCVDSLTTGRRRNIQHLERESRFVFIEHDLITGAPDLPQVDRIYHLASPASPPGYKRHAITTLRVNSEGTYHLLTLAANCGARFLYASTSEAYGDPVVHPQSEDYRGNVSSIGPRSMYDEAKRFGEAMTMTFVRSCNVDARIARIFNTYGPRSDPDDGRMIPNFVTQALGNEDITVYGDGDQTRSLCYVSDLVDGLWQLMETPLRTGALINLGNPEEHTVLEFAQMVIRLTCSRSQIVFTEPVVGDDPQRRCPDITRARKLLEWSPRVGLEEGLTHTIQYFRTELAAVRR